MCLERMGIHKGPEFGLYGMPNGLRGMRVNVSEIEFSCDQEEDGSHVVKADHAARLAFGGWKQAIDGLDKAIGLTSSSPADDAVKVIANHARDIFHGLHLWSASHFFSIINR